jgi:hypothetical protein
VADNSGEQNRKPQGTGGLVWPAHSCGVRNHAIVGKSRIGATLHRCERSLFPLHPNDFPVAGTLDQAQTLLSPATQQYEPPSDTAKSSLKLIPKRDIHAEPLQVSDVSGCNRQFKACIVRHYFSHIGFYFCGFWPLTFRNLERVARVISF